MKTTEIKDICNYYGGLHVLKIDDKHYWLIENYDTDFADIKEYEEISKCLYDELIKHNQ